MKPIKLIAITGFISLSILIMQGTALAASGLITILKPANGEVFKNGSNNELEYNVTLSPSGNHLHVYIDDQSPMIVRKVTNCPCSVELPKLSSGKHTIAVKEATVSHALTGLQGSVTFSVK
jgi:hypothetical protein